MSKDKLKCPRCGNELSVNDLIARQRYNECVFCGYIVEKEVEP